MACLFWKDLFWMNVWHDRLLFLSENFENWFFSVTSWLLTKSRYRCVTPIQHCRTHTHTHTQRKSRVHTRSFLFISTPAPKAQASRGLMQRWGQKASQVHRKIIFENMWREASWPHQWISQYLILITQNPSHYTELEAKLRSWCMACKKDDKKNTFPLV